MKLVIGADHAGFKLKELIKAHLKEKGFDIEDVGTFSEDSVDYPDFAEKVASEVAGGRGELGILVCGTGIGVSIAANKTLGIRAANCSTIFEAKMARAHNNANIICVGSRVVGDAHAIAIVEAFLSEKFEGGRHQRRLDRIAEIERKRFLKKI